jgi:cytoskeletal protein CcmA (bactofilin family)
MPRTVIGPETRVAGALSGKDELVVEGTVDGAVSGDTSVIIAAGATVNGDVRGREVVVGGVLRHNIQATQSVRLLATAEVYGDITTPRIAIDEGAVFEGSMRMKSPERRAANSPMRAAKPEPEPQPAPQPAPAPALAQATSREIPSLPALGRQTATRRK